MFALSTMRSPIPAEVMDITTMLNKKGNAAAQQHHHHFAGGFPEHAHTHFSLIKAEPTMERSGSPHGSEHSQYSASQGMSRSYPSPTAQMQSPMHLPNAMPNGMQMASYTDVSTVPHQMHNMNMQQMQHSQHHALGQQQQQQQHQQQQQQQQQQQIMHPQHPQHQPQQPLPTLHHQHAPQHHQPHQQDPQHQHQLQASIAVKAYPCGTCGKGFARRSDLARHERIHSGVKPHVCEFANCGKTFIQRSALTVHQRVHTGEKPHHCETCAKRFSDSSSLARHRRTHSGKRPYKCPYADCQKTFTRRTTLTRHQNHHSGTIEEAAAATAAALAASKGRGLLARTDSDPMSSHGSTLTTPSPGQRTMSMSPHLDISVTGAMNRHVGDFQYLQQNSPLPPHLRVGSGSPASTSSGGYGGGGIRPTSHPTSYGPPPILEPNVESHQNGTGSAGASPHMANVGWNSPTHVPSPTHDGSSYVYPNSDAFPPGATMNQMYYAAAPQMRRPQSAEPNMVHMA